MEAMNLPWFHAPPEISGTQLVTQPALLIQTSYRLLLQDWTVGARKYPTMEPVQYLGGPNKTLSGQNNADLRRCLRLIGDSVAGQLRPRPFVVAFSGGRTLRPTGCFEILGFILA